jgi:hypothetical protein
MFRIYPNDADGDALQRVADDGSDMSQPMMIDFCVAVPNESAAKAIAELVILKGYVPDIAKDDDRTKWSCYCKKEMVPTYNAIIVAQEELNELSKPYGGHSDGWGTSGNKDKLN